MTNNSWWIIAGIGRYPYSLQTTGWGSDSGDYNIKNALRFSEKVVDLFEKKIKKIWNVSGAYEWIEIEVLQGILRLTLLARTPKDRESKEAFKWLIEIIGDLLKQEPNCWKKIPKKIATPFGGLSIMELQSNVPKICFCVIEAVALEALFDAVEDDKTSIKKVKIKRL